MVEVIVEDLEGGEAAAEVVREVCEVSIASPVLAC